MDREALIKRLERLASRPDYAGRDIWSGTEQMDLAALQRHLEHHENEAARLFKAEQL